MKSINKENIIKTIAGLIAFIILYYVLTTILQKYGIPPEKIKSFVQSLEFLGVFVLYFLIALSVIIPVPYTPLAIMVNILYGPLVGFICVLLATLTGAVIDFYLIRKFGRDFFKMKFPIISYDINIVAKKYGFISIVFLRAFPIVPFDISSYIAALSRIKIRTFILATLIGLLPLSLTYALLGTGLESNNQGKTILAFILGISVMAITLIISKLYSEKWHLNDMDVDPDDKNEKEDN